jgi:hypothetical protein
MLASTGQVKIDSAGTGETIGHIADLTIQNLTDQPLTCAIPPMILESGSGKNQHYACPKGKTVALKPHGSATVPMDGVCVDRSKPPVGKGVTGDLVINEGNPTIPQNPNSHMPPKDANNLLRLCASKYDAADKLLKDGGLKDLPYHDKQKQKDIVVQWSTWTDPQISEITGAPPATKEDLKKVVYKQVEQNGPMTPETKKKVDQGIDTIFEKVELTTAKAKDLEKPDTFAAENSGESSATEGVNVSNDTPTPAPPPQTQEKPKKYKFPTPYVTPQTQEEPKKYKFPTPYVTPQTQEEPKKYKFPTPYVTPQTQEKPKKYKFPTPYVTPQTQEKGPNNWPKPIQDWVDKQKAAADAAHKWQKLVEHHFESKQRNKGYDETPEGQKELKELEDAHKAELEADAAANEAGKNIDQVPKDAFEQAERDRKAAETDNQKKDEKPRP